MRYNILWHEMDSIVEAMAMQLETWKRSVAKPQICAVARGGLVFATALSHKMGIPIASVLFAQTYQGTRNEGTLLKESSMLPLKSVKDTIFVDDILDTGSTFEAIDAKYPGARFVVPFAKEEGLARCKHMLRAQPLQVFQGTVWIQFPWEVA